MLSPRSDSEPREQIRQGYTVHVTDAITSRTQPTEIYNDSDPHSRMGGLASFRIHRRMYHVIHTVVLTRLPRGRRLLHRTIASRLWQRLLHVPTNFQQVLVLN